MAGAVLLPVVASVGFAWLNFDGYEHVGSWVELGKAMAIYGVAYGDDVHELCDVLHRRCLRHNT